MLIIFSSGRMWCKLSRNLYGIHPKRVIRFIWNENLLSQIMETLPVCEANTPLTNPWMGHKYRFIILSERDSMYAGCRLNVKMSSNQRRNSHYINETSSLQLSHLPNENFCTGKTFSLYWIGHMFASSTFLLLLIFSFFFFFWGGGYIMLQYYNYWEVPSWAGRILQGCLLITWRL